MRKSKIASSAESRMVKTFQKFLNLCNFDSFRSRKNSENL